MSRIPSGSPPKLNHLQFLPFPTFPENFRNILQTNSGKNITFLVEVIITKQKVEPLCNTKHKERPKPKIVRTVDYNCAFVLIMAVLIIFPVILQTVINLIMLSIGGQREI